MVYSGKTTVKLGEQLGGLMRSFEVIHCIPSPYRLHLFTVLGRALEVRGIDLCVHFMARGHADRAHWTGELPQVLWKYKFWTDVGPNVRGKEWHLNCGLIAHLWRQPPEYLLVGGPWDSSTGALVSFLNHSPVKVAWFEGNTSTPGHIQGVGRLIKKTLLKRYTSLAVPGREGSDLARMILGNCELPISILPNIVDEKKFVCVPNDRREMRARYGVGENELFVLWPARLIPEKGIELFLSAVRTDDLIRMKIVILGDGPLRAQIDCLIRGRGLDANVGVHEPCSYEKMPSVYRAADVFLLPSVHDSNPLSVVEAMHSSLPIVVSDRIGNFPEALTPGVNGWCVDPYRGETVRSAMRDVAGKTKQELTGMGNRSAEIAARFWSSDRAIERFLDDVVGPRPPAS